ncbi:MAG: D-alanine--D-serine ligase VanG [Syntrophomonadaceae bacterium]|nr:D-alanine--D-serine ligase VanG [Syntrophomonadaceae bacterium]
MDRTRVAIIFGGCSPEYGVSLQSAHAVISHLPPERYELILLGITRQGEWRRYYGDISAIPDDRWHLDAAACVPAIISPDRHTGGIIEFEGERCRFTPVDAAFPVLHGKNGEDGTVQGLIALAGIPLVGCDTLSSALGMDKHRAHKLAAAQGIAVPAGTVLTGRCDDAARRTQTAHLKYPLFVKPVKAGSSLGISRIESPEQLAAAVKLALEHDDEVIIEESVPGFEVGCAVLGHDELLLGLPDEIELSHGFFDFTEKYSLQNSRIHMPARIDPDTAERVRQTAAAIYQALGCTGFARVDMFLTPDGGIVFNEVNTIPGFTAHSRYPNMMRGIGLSFTELLERLIALGMAR